MNVFPIVNLVILGGLIHFPKATFFIIIVPFCTIWIYLFYQDYKLEKQWEKEQSYKDQNNHVELYWKKEREFLHN